MEDAKNIYDIVMQVLSQFASAIPNIIGGLFVIFIGWLIAKIVRKAIQKILAGIKIDKLAEKLNDTDFVSESNMKIVPSKVISTLIYYTLMLVFMMAAAQVIQLTVVSEMIQDLINYIPKFFTAFILFILGILIADVVKKFILTTCNSLGIPSGKIIANFVFYIIFITITISALQQAAIETGLISDNLSIILSGVVFAFSLGYGLAAKDVMSNFLASFYSKSKIKIGDEISLDGTRGEVIEMDSTSLSLKSEGKITVIPLRKLTSEKLEIYKK